MKNYKIRWKIRSPLETELQSDTIFGHLCWAIRYIDGKEKLQSFLTALKQSPVFRLTSASPEGYLPFPKIPLSNRNKSNLKKMMGFEKKDPEFEYKLKELKKTKWISVALWEKLKNGFSIHDAYYSAWEKYSQREKKDQHDQFFDAQDELKIEPFKMKSQLITHSLIDRLTGTAAKGLLYDEPVTFYRDGAVFTSFIQTDFFTENEINKYLQYIEQSGFGKNKSTGKGCFRITIENHELPEVNSPNAWLNLSNCVPANEDPITVSYEGFTKFGKTGGNYALEYSPFKYPLYMLKPGSVFFSEEKPKGSLVEGIHPDRPDIVQFGYSYSIPFMIKEFSDD